MTSTWIIVVTPIITGIITAGLRSIARKIDAVGVHLRQQDERHLGMTERLSRVEGSLGLKPLPPPDIK